MHYLNRVEAYTYKNELVYAEASISQLPYEWLKWKVLKGGKKME